MWRSLTVVSNSLWPHALYIPWNSSGRNTRVGSLSLPSPGDLPNPGIELRSPTLQADSLPTEPQRKPKNTGVGSLSLLQQIFPSQELNLGLLHCRWILYQLSDHRSPLCAVMKGFPAGASGEDPPGSVVDIRATGSIPGPGRFPGEGNDNPLQYAYLKNPRDRGVWQTIVHSIAKSQTQMRRVSMHALSN